MAVRRAALALGASALLLAGCAPAIVLPPPMTQAEIKRTIAEGNEQWWNAMFPDEPMPVVDPIEYVDVHEQNTQYLDCLKAADLEGITFSDTGGWTTSGDLEQNNAVNRASFVCQLQYPYDISDPAELGYLSDAQANWLWYFNRDRLVPCLKMLGYTVMTHPGEYVEGSINVIPPYYEMSPRPDDDDWDLIDFRCPPSPVGPDYRPRSP